MRTLQEKYNGIQEGKFSKEHFLAEARMQQPQLITRFNGYDDTVQILKNKGMIRESKAEDSTKEVVTEAKLTKKSLTDYRYKPTNDMDKYPYEQILRGIRVELEALQVLGTPTAEEYSKALAKVSKNLEKDSIFYTNQVAGVNPKVDLHDKMVPFTDKAKVDTFNGMKKAALKEGFKKLIKKVLSENMGDMFGDEETAQRKANYGQPGQDEYEFFSDPENYKKEKEQEKPRFTFNNDGDFGDETDFGDEPEQREEEDVYEMYGEDKMDKSKMGDVYILAQESDTLKDFLIAVKQQHPDVDIRRDIKDLQDIWNSRGEVNENYFSNYGMDDDEEDGDEDEEEEPTIPYRDRKEQPDPDDTAEYDEFYEVRKAKSLSQLLK